VADFFTLDPLVPENLLTLREELAVKHGVTNEISALFVGGGHKGNVRHDQRRVKLAGLECRQQISVDTLAVTSAGP
jgi:hypothetical protein